MPTETISPEVECLKLKAAINENHRLAQKAAGDAIERAVLTGELLCKWKELLPRGKFECFVESHFEGSARTAQLYMQASKGLSSLPKAQRIALLSTEDSLNGLISRMKKDDSVAAGRDARASEGTPRKSEGGSNPPATAQISDKGKPGGAATSSDNSPASTGPASEEAADFPEVYGGTSDLWGKDADSGTETTEEPQERDPRPPRSGKDKPGTGYVGKCPSCASSKWTAEGFCAKCGQPFGEPVGDRAPDEDPAGIKRAKAVKTAEALMREFDDLNLLVPKPGAHKQCIELCKSLLKSAKGWK